MKSLVQLYLFEIRYSLLDIRYSLFLFSFFVSHSSFAQEDTAIVRTYGGPYYEEGRQIIECAEGGYAIIGTTGSDQQNNTNFYLLRLDEELNCMWSKSLGGPEVEWGYSLLEDADGNFLLCGYTNSYGAGAYDVLVYKVDAEGEVIWQQTFGGTDWDFAYKIIAHPEEGYLICGKTYSMGNGGSDGYLLHVDDDGELISEWTYGGEGDDEFVDALLLTQNAQIVLVGSRFNIFDQKVNSWLLAIDVTGFVLHDEMINNDSDSECVGITGGTDSFAIANRHSNNGNWTDYTIEKRNFDFESLWTITENYCDISSISVLSNGYAFTGTTEMFGAGGKGAFIEKVDAGGGYQAAPTFGGALDDYSTYVTSNSNLQVVLLGTSNSYSENLNQDIYVVLFPNEQITQEYVLDLDSFSCFITSISEVDLLQKPPFILENSHLTISDFSLINSFSIFDLTGRKVFDVSNQRSIDLSHIPEGIYFFVPEGLNDEAIKFCLN